jgi:hypothetical protein
MKAYLQKVISKKPLKKTSIFDGVLSATDEKSRIRIQSRILMSVVRIRIRTKLSRIYYTGYRNWLLGIT